MRGFALVMSGTVVAQLISLVATIFLARLYSSSAFGFLAVVGALAGLFAPLVLMRFDSALMLPRSRRTASALFVSSALSAICGSALIGLALHAVVATGLSNEWSELPALGFWVGLTTLLTAAFTLASQIALRSHKYGAVGTRNAIQSAAVAIAQVLSTSLGTIGLVIGQSLGRLVGIVPLLAASRREFSPFSRADMTQAWRTYWKFPALFAPSAVLNGVGVFAPTLFVGLWFGIQDAGQWGMAERVLAVPLSLVGAVAGQVIEASFASNVRNKEGDPVRSFLRASIALSGVGVLIVVAVIILAPMVIPSLLGPGWGKAASIMQLLSIMVAIRLVASPLSKILLVNQAAVLNLALDTSRVLAVGGATLVIMITGASILEAAAYFSIAMSTIYVATWAVSLLVVVRAHR